MSRQCMVCVMLSALLLSTAGAFGGPIYVKTAASGTADGSSWANAMGSIQAAIDLASTSGRSVWVAGGTYDPGNTLFWPSNAKAFGGFHDGDTLFSQRDIAGNPSIITGAGVRRVMNIDSVVNTRVDGFTLTSGNTADWAGGALYMSSLDSSNRLVNCIIRDSVAPVGHGGGAISNASTGHIIENCTFENNTCTHMGGGLFIHHSSATVRDCTFTNNESGVNWHGGGVAVWESPATTITRSNFINNRATAGTSGGGLFCGSNGNAAVSQCLFQGNTSEVYGGGVHIENAQPTFVDSVFLNNSATHHGGGAFAGSNNPMNVVFQRCLFQGNSVNGAGGAMGLHGWSGQPFNVTIGGCHFTGNTSQGDGGALDVVNPGVTVTVNGTSFVDNHAGLAAGGQAGAIRNLEQSVLNLNRCGFFGNTTQVGGGGAIFNHVRGVLTATNCVFDNNHAPWIGGGIAVWGSAATINHCTFNRNGNGGGAAHGVWVDSSPAAASATISNSIFWGPYGAPQLGQNTPGLLSVNYSNVQGGWAGTGNQNTDPLFVDGGNGNCRLQAGSPCRDTADPASALTVDIFNNARPGAGAGAARDKGAYEWNNSAPSVLSIEPRTGEVNPTNTRYVVFTVTFDEGIGGQAYDYLNGVTAGHFGLTTTGSISGASIVHVAGNTTTRTVVVQTGTGSGTIRLDMNSTTGLACSGNLGLANVPFTSGAVFTVDKTRPQVSSINRASANPSNAGSVDFTVTFNESVSGVTEAAFDLVTTGGIAGAAITGLSGTGSTRSVTVDTGTGDGTLGLRLGNGASVFDGVGNMLENWIYDGQTFTIDKTPPDAPVVSGTTPTNNVRPTWNWVQGANPGNSNFRYDLNNSGSWTSTIALSFTPGADLGEGSHTLVVQERDVAGNWSGDGSFTIVIDLTPPNPPVVSGVTPTNNVRPTWNWVSGGGGSGNFRYDLNGSGSWTNTPALSFTPGGDLADGPHVLTVQERDGVGNWSVSGSHTITVDTVPPNVTLAPVSAVDDPTDQTSIAMTVTFDKAVTGFTATDISLLNASVDGFTAVSPTEYTFNLLPQAQGSFGAQVVGGAAVDAAGNGNLASNSFSGTFQSDRPTVTLASVLPNPTNTSPIPVTVTFNTPVTGFVAGDVTVVNGVVSDFSGSGAAYSFNLTPTGQGEVTAQVPADAAQDGFGAWNSASNTLLRTYDTVAPSVVLVSGAASNPTNDTSIPVSADFDEPVYGFAVGDITVTNATAANFTGADGDESFSFTLTPTVAEGAITVSVAAGVASDAAGNANTATAEDLTLDFDGVAPTVAAVTMVDGLTVAVTFSEVMGDGVLDVANYALSGSGKGTLADAPDGVTLDSGATYHLSWAGGEMFDGGDITITVSNAEDLAYNAVGDPDSGTDAGGAVGVPPTALCQDVVVNLSSPVLTVDDVDAGSSDDVGIASLLINGAATLTFSCADIATNPNVVTLEALDAAGNAASCVAEITVVDDVPPVIAIPGENPRNLVVGMIFSPPTVTAVDNCDGPVAVDMTDDGGIAVSPDPVTEGTYTRVYEAEDSAGNKAIAELVIVVGEAAPIEVNATSQLHFARPVGGTVTFSVEASGGASALSFQWKRIVADDKGLVTIPDANAPAYTISSIVEADAGEYLCEVFDFVTTQQSDIFTLEVFDAYLPVAGALGLSIAAALAAVAGAAFLRKRD